MGGAPPPGGTLAFTVLFADAVAPGAAVAINMTAFSEGGDMVVSSVPVDSVVSASWRGDGTSLSLSRSVCLSFFLSLSLSLSRSLSLARSPIYTQLSRK